MHCFYKKMWFSYLMSGIKFAVITKNIYDYYSKLNVDIRFSRSLVDFFFSSHCTRKNVQKSEIRGKPV